MKPEIEKALEDAVADRLGKTKSSLRYHVGRIIMYRKKELEAREAGNMRARNNYRDYAANLLKYIKTVGRKYDHARVHGLRKLKEMYRALESRGVSFSSLNRAEWQGKECRVTIDYNVREVQVHVWFRWRWVFHVRYITNMVVHDKTLDHILGHGG
jgi:hypothetical protein